MSSEVCPFCGKSFKRLKSHLPHCKAAKSSKTASPQHEETKMSSSPSLSPPGPKQSQHSAKTETSMQKMSLDTKGNEQVVRSSITTTSAKKTKLKLSEKIKMAAEMASTASVASSSPSLTSKTKKKVPVSRQINKEIGNNVEKVNLFVNAKTKPKFSVLSSKNDEAAFEKLGTDFEQLNVNAAELAKSTVENKNVNNSQTGKKTAAAKNEMKDVLTKKSSSNKVNNAKTSPKENFWLEEEKMLPENDVCISRGEAKVTLHDVRTSLGRTKQNGRRFIDKLSTDELKLETVNQNALVSVEQEVPSQVMALAPGKKQLVPLKSGDFMSDLAKIENKDCSFSQSADTLKDGLRMDRHTMGLAALSSPARTFLEAEVSSKAFRKDAAMLLKPNVQKTERDTEETRREQRTQDGGQRTTRAALSQQRLAQVTLRELPDWLVLRSPRRPRDALQMLQRGWQWYYRRYIDVRRGGVGGVAMLLVGYSVLSYVWVYPHLKRDRWRRYH